MSKIRRQRSWRSAFAGFLCGLSVTAWSAVEVEPLSTPELQARYEVLIEEMRCPKCQNQNLADSDSLVAKDLRREIRRLLEEGLTDREIADYMVARYGDFVLYRPPVQANTLALWLAPGVFAVIGLLALVVIVLRSRRGAGASPEGVGGKLTESERRQLQQLLEENVDGLTSSGIKSDD